MFDGGFKGKRGISLGGSNAKAVDKAALLKTAASERALREREKLRLKAATRIQSLWRAKTHLHQQREDMRNEWAQRQLLSSLDPASAFLNQARVLLFVCKPANINPGDVQLLAAWIQSLLAKEAWRMPLSLDAEQRDAWLHILPKLLVLCTRVCAHESCSRENASILLGFVSQVLQQVPVTNSTLSNNNFSSRLPNSLVDRGFLGHLKTLVEVMPLIPDIPSTTATNVSNTTTLFHILTTFLPLIPPFQTVMTQVTDIMMVANLPSKLTKREYHAFLDMFPLRSWTEFVDSRKEKLVDELSDNQRAAFLANLVDIKTYLFDSKSGRVDLDTGLGITSLLTFLVDSLPVGYFATLDRALLDDEVDGDSDDDDDDHVVGMQVDSATVPTPSIESLDANTQTRLNSLVELTSIAIWAVKSGNSAAIQSIAGLVVVLVHHWPAKKSRILESITRALPVDGKLIPAALAVLKTGPVWKKSVSIGERSGWVALLRDRAREGEWILVAFLGEVLGHGLQLLSDGEFLAYKEVYVWDVVALSSVVRNVLFHVFWTGTAFSSSGLLSKYSARIVDTLTSLLEQIYSRDSRRQFCPTNHWQMTSELEMSSFIQNAIADPTDPSALPNTAGSPIRSITTSSPRQQILSKIPYVIPFETRAKIFRAWIQRDREINNLDAAQWLRPLARVQIRRDHVFEDAYAALNPLGPKIKHRIAVTFVSSLDGEVEAGIDGGGVFKEFLSELLKEVFGDTLVGLFQSTPDNLIYPQTNAKFDYTRLRQMEFFGRVIGKALYEGILVDAGFAGFFLSKWLGRQSYLDDLASLDADLYNGLMFLKNYRADDVERDLSLTFSAQEEGGEVVELVPGGSSLPVTGENRIKYIYLMANYKLNVRIGRASRAFFQGLNAVIDTKWLKIFNQTELQMLLGGASVPINLEDLKQNITYGGDFHELHPTIRLFWEVVEDEDFGEENRRLLVKFVTSCERPPLLGFAELKPGFCIRPSGESEDRLPSASTCVNMLKLPEYRTKTVLREKLMYAIRSNAGFELS